MKKFSDSTSTYIQKSTFQTSTEESSISLGLTTTQEETSRITTILNTSLETTSVEKSALDEPLF